ncbi:uncharacterized protein LOC143038248 [Oratosquilla oratoria]|uniref:uncharacterized protein LOC143038248 n=1 Tax=Oratosquilla oratoria TaxID=337810 RepID=UPI003F77467F
MLPLVLTMSSCTEKLIEAVRQQRVLYDTNHPKYMKGAYKDEIWSDIAHTLQFKDGAAAKEAWLKIRNCHRDALRRQKKLKCTSESRTVIVKQWKYQQQMEFLIPFMTNRETSSYVAWSDNGSQLTVEGEISSDEEMNAPPTTASRENLTSGDVLPDFDAADDGEAIADPSAYSKDIKRKKLSDTRKKKIDLLKEKLGPQGTDPLYNFFMAMYGTTAKMEPASQLMIKREVFRIVSDAEETLLGMSPYGHSSLSSSDPTTRVCTPADPSTADMPVFATAFIQ